MSKPNSGFYNGTLGSKAQLIQELRNQNIKFSEHDILFITRDKTRQIIWLETGNKSAGLKHILDGNGTTRGHADDFQNAFGISRSDVPAYLEQVISNGTVVSNTLKPAGRQMGFERTYYYNGEHHVIVGLGTNGLIVSAYPIRKRK